MTLVLIAGTALSAAAQTDDAPSPPQPKLHYTLGKSYDEAIWRILDYLIDELNTDPSADGRIISYGTPSQIAFFQRIVRKRLKTVKFDASRVALIKGGPKPQTEHQFWIVPAGATAPEPKNGK